MDKVFISHANKDKKIINEFIKSIERLGYEVFFSSNSHNNSIPFGTNMYEKIRDEIEESDTVIAVVSENFYRSIPCQIEMGISYAFKKGVVPLIIENKPDYTKILRGIFNHLERAPSIYNREDLTTILAGFSSSNSKINNCVDNIIEELDGFVERDHENDCKEHIHDNLILQLYDTGGLNIDECIFIKYMVEKRRFDFECGWQMDEGVEKFQNWLTSTAYYIEGEVKEFYEDIIKYFFNIGVVEKSEFTSHGNAKLYKVKQKYIREILDFYYENKEDLDKICVSQIIPF